VIFPGRGGEAFVVESHSTWWWGVEGGGEEFQEVAALSAWW
jgi:hypothetical protein